MACQWARPIVYAAVTRRTVNVQQLAMTALKPLPPATCLVCKRAGLTRVRFATAPGVCATREGAVAYAAGDALLTGIADEVWPVARVRFLADYAPAKGTAQGMDGDYEKTAPTASAVRLSAPAAVPLGPGGLLHGRAGDWLLRYADGSLGIVAADIFALTYDILEPI
jgi:PGDYG protein